jgi:hypothetical protein
LRLARVHRRERRWGNALEAYGRLGLLANIAIDGIPADLVARTARCSVIEESGSKAELGPQAAALESDLLAGHWALDRPAWELTVEKLEQWTVRGLSVSAERKQASAVADWLWEEWKRNGGKMPLVLRRAIIVEGTPVTLVSQRSGANLMVLAVFSSLMREWIEQAIRGTRITASQARLVGDSGETLAGPTAPIVPGALRFLGADTSLPWTLVLTPGDSSLVAQAFAQRRRLSPLALDLLSRYLT